MNGNLIFTTSPLSSGHAIAAESSWRAPLAHESGSIFPGPTAASLFGTSLSQREYPQVTHKCQQRELSVLCAIFQLFLSMWYLYRRPKPISTHTCLFDWQQHPKLVWHQTVLHEYNAQTLRVTNTRTTTPRLRRGYIECSQLTLLGSCFFLCSLFGKIWERRLMVAVVVRLYDIYGFWWRLLPSSVGVSLFVLEVLLHINARFVVVSPKKHKYRIRS